MDLDYAPSSENVATKLTKQRGFYGIRLLEALLDRFSPFERLSLYSLTILLGLSSLALLADLNAAVSVDQPLRGGSLVEGQIGPARFINPVFTMSKPDEDLTALVYSGLMRAEDGSYIQDIASAYEISEDGTQYTFHIKDGVTFHDGKPLTSADIVYTIMLTQNPAIKSPHRADWDGVQVSAPDPKTVVFKLPHAYAPFIENTTLGILPKHLWEGISAEEFPFSPLNTHPVGSGPYKVANVETDSTGAATRYDLVPFNRSTLAGSFLGRISFVFFRNEDELIKGLNNGKVDAAAGITPAQLSELKRDDLAVLQAPLPRTFGVFFNQNHSSVLADASVRAALDKAVDKQAIVKDVLGGYGSTLSGPIPTGILPGVSVPIATSTNFADAAKAQLSSGGWKFDEAVGVWTKKSGKTSEELSLTLATADEPELVATANKVAEMWRAAGVKVTVQVYPISEFNTEVLRPRSYDAVLFGEVVGRTLDLYAFWHSSQRNDPGLNLAMYTSSKADSLLTQARASTDSVERKKLYADFMSTIEKDHPAVFLYAPSFIYVVPKDLQGIKLGALTTPAERFLNAYAWYTQTERVWSIFARS